VDAADQRKAWLIQLIKDRKQALKNGQQLEDNVLHRLICLQKEPGNEWLTTTCCNAIWRPDHGHPGNDQ